MPVGTPSRASIETVKAVPNGVVVLIGHLAQPELGQRSGVRHRQMRPRPAGHEVDGCGCDELGRDREVALVLAILVVDDDDEAAGADLLERFVDRGKRRRPAHHGHTGW